MKFRLFIIFIFSCYNISAQTISGNFSKLPNQTIKLEGFNGLKTYAVSSTKSDEKGNFKLNYTKSDGGVGYLMSSDNKSLFVILSGENIEILGEALSRVIFQLLTAIIVIGVGHFAFGFTLVHGLTTFATIMLLFIANFSNSIKYS